MQIKSTNTELKLRSKALHFAQFRIASDRKRRTITHFTHVRVQHSSSSSSTAADAIVDEAAKKIHYSALLSFDTNGATAQQL